MAQFPILRLTHAGHEMAGMSQGGGKLTFVRVELGDGQLKEEDSIEALTDLKRSVMQLPLQGYLNEGNGKARLRFVIDNSALTVGFHNREVGIFAKIDNGAERLYAYTNAGNYADWIPSKETPIDGDIVDLHIVIGNAANVTIQTVSGAYATKIELEEHSTAAELDHPDGSVTTPKIRDAAVTGEKIAKNTIEKEHLKKGVLAPGDVGAYSKSEVDSRVNAKVSKNGDKMTGILEVPHVNFDYGYIQNGSRDTGDAIADNGGANINIASWWGIGFYNKCYGKYTGTMDLRSGDWRTIGRMKADGGFEGTATNANKLQNWTLQNILDEFLNVWHANKAYTIGDISYHKNLPSWARLECVIAGTTGNNANVFSKNVKAGQYIIDGGVKWIVDDVRDCNRVGSITGSLYLPDGYVKANGATVQRADYPRLVALADRYNLWTSDTGANAGLFGRGDGSRTMVLPNHTDRMAQFAANSIGTSVPAGLPNITGTTVDGFVMGYIDGSRTATGTGAITVNTVDRTTSYGTGPATRSTVGIDASRSNSIYGRSSTVQPAAIRLIPIIRY